MFNLKAFQIVYVKKENISGNIVYVKEKRINGNIFLRKKETLNAKLLQFYGKAMFYINQKKVFAEYLPKIIYFVYNIKK